MGWEEEKEDQKESDEIISHSNLEEELRIILEQVLQTALNNDFIKQKMSNLTAAQQCVIADRICLVKEKLLKNMVEKIQGDVFSNVITPQFVKECMQELSTELSDTFRF